MNPVCPLVRPARWIVLVGLLCCLPPLAAPAAERNSSYLAALDSISAGDLKQHVDYLADDFLEGREAGTQGGRTAGDYLAEWFEGLQLRGGGEEGGFFQPFRANFRNVLGLLPGSDPILRREVIVIGAHYDHIGYGTPRNSRGPVGQIHNGADDNASGVAGLVELIQAFSMLPEPPKRTILFAAWDAEEKGLFGTKHWVAEPTVPLKDVVFALNMDMIGRLRNRQLHVYGSRSGYGLRRLLSRHNHELSLDFHWTMKPNADHWSFFDNDVPVLTLHTGLHEQYHRPGDDAELINNPGIRQIVLLAFEAVYDLANRDTVSGFRRAARHETEDIRRQLEGRVPQLDDRLGATWAKQESDEEGVRLVGIVAGSPAEEAGLRVGDRIVKLAGRKIRTSDELNWAIAAVAGPAAVLVRRQGEREPIELTVELTVELDGDPLRLGITWRVDTAEPGAIILTHVVPGSPAARAGLQPKERIFQVAGRDFDDDEQFVELAKTMPGPIELLVERDGKLRTVVVHFKTNPLKRAA